ncbi:MAG: hypothetical protein RR296_02260 [Clostridia bacterium]
MAEGNIKRRDISVLNWLGTLFLSIIPGVNLVMFFVWAFASKRATKRHFAIAALILTVLLLVVGVLACALYGDAIVGFLERLTPSAAPTSPIAPIA